MSSSHRHPVATSAARSPATQPPRLLEQRIHRLGLSLRTEQAYVGRVRRFIIASDKRHPRALGARQVESFLTNLATH